MAVPANVLAAGWIPFTVVLLLALFFSFIYVRYFQSKYDSELCSSLTCIIGLFLALLTSALVPVDIFLVSYMKDSDGNFKKWAKSNITRLDVENDVLYAYYALYLCVMLFIFVLLPFAYFFYEEGDEETTCKSRACTAFKYTLVFMFAAAVLLVIGAFAPIKHVPSSNATDMQIIEDIFKDTNSEDAISFCISSLTLLGLCATVIYTGYGMSAWPMDLVKGRRSASREREEVSHHRNETQQQIDNLRREQREGRRLRRREQHHLEELEERERYMARREQRLEVAEQSCIGKCLVIFRPFQICFGIVFFIMEILVFISLLLTNIDKIMHSPGWRFGFALPQRVLPNPLDIVLVYAQKAFPLDYILMLIIILYFVFCSMGGLQHIGIWCCCMRMYKIRVRHTKPQGLLFMCFLLMFIVLALNIIIYEITPQYTTFGSQKYLSTTSPNVTEVLSCTTDAAPDQCVMTRMSMLLVRFFYKVWFFGVAYFVLSWAFLFIIVVGFLVSLIRKRRSVIEGAVDRDDLTASDDPLIQA